MSFPKIDTCIVCENIRPELNHKTILLGFFGITPYVLVELADFKQLVSLCFVSCGAGGPPLRCERVQLRLTDPSGAVISNPTNAPDIVGGLLAGDRTTTNIFMGFVGFVTHPGQYGVALVADGVERYSTTFQLAHMTARSPANPMSAKSGL
jgi:hypothetical protein